MESDFWHQKWKRNEIGFHNDDVNYFLAKYFHLLSLEKESRIFLPLCGKTKDIHWLLEKKFRVVGVELSSIAIEQLFDDLGIVPSITEHSSFKHYSTLHLDMYCGDIFDMSEAIIGEVHAVYDRAALVALPKDTRAMYAAHIISITHHAPQLLVTYEYNQSLVSGPPFSVDIHEIREHFQDFFTINLLESKEVSGGMKGQCESKECAWLLRA